MFAIASVFLLPYAMAIKPAFSTGSSAITDTATVKSDGFIYIFQLFTFPAVRRILSFTLIQALASAALAMLIGLPGAWLYSKTDSSLAGWLRTFTALPFVLPPILITLGFVLFFGNSGWLNRALALLTGSSEPTVQLLYRSSAIVIAHAFYNFPIVIRLAGDAFINSRRNYVPTASVLGASETNTFFTIALPLCAPAIFASFLLVFLYSFTSFAIVLVLGGGPSATTIAVEIYRAARMTLDFKLAGGLALLETIVATFVYLLYLFSERRLRRYEAMGNERSLGENSIVRSQKKSNHFHPFKWLYLLFLLIFVGGPLISLVLESFLIRSGSEPRISIHWWATLVSEAGPAMLRSLLLAIVSASTSCLLAVMTILSRPLSRHHKFGLGEIAAALCVVPMASSGIILGLGFISLYPTSFSRSFWAVSLIHAVSALPFAYRSIAEGFDALSEALPNASAVLGANPFKTTVYTVLPVLSPRIRSAWAFAAAISLGELNAVLMLGLEGWETLPILIYRSAGAYRFGSACAAGALLLAACLICFTASELNVNPSRSRNGFGNSPPM